MRDLKAKIEKQYAQKRLDDNIKLGPGGIREIEFIAQSFQLVRGGHCEELQTQSLYKALAAAEQLGFLDQKAYAALLEAYEFLRMVENRLQQRRDQQVHHLPESEAEQELLSGVLGVDDYGAFLAVLDAQRAVVREQFQQVLVTDSSEESAVSREVGEAFSGLKNSAAYEQLSERAQGYIAQIMSHLSRSDFSADALDFLVRLVEQVLKRSTYLAWLAEQPAALQRLLFFATRSSWMAEQVLQQPALMDELVDDRALQSLPNAEQKSALLLQQLSRVPSDDLEQAMDVCRRFKASQQFLIAAADVAGYLPVMQVSDHLSELAEVILQQSLDWVAAELQQRTGRPQLLLEGQSRDAQMVVIGYGKLGGLELGYGSDLDIVLLHDGNGKALGTNGDKALENAVYFQRLGQRFVHFLSANTPSGRLYEIDTRLRPSGNSGLLVTSLQSYENYQRESAWTWEHQALVRARAVAGPQALKTQFEEVRLALLCLKRDPAELKRDVVEMREKMREHLDDSDNEHTNLKPGPGGLVDIELICQYMVLRYASESCGLFEITDNARQLQRLVAAGALEARQADELTAAYLAIRGATHHQRLGCPAPQLDMPLSNYREQVVGIWLELLE
ncbi:MAG: bifunctional [glutamate--ammonia ligase]-adenylyl-L-tyrosine phosphorylase/[glutamate--ammonia-ligase] adenylyltransferase [Gammaproteobacteria bacterium]|nr:bifunctional [glutamate--ammonia ligase]-adenylyl-L-tyrosine phosphorylase/[glutamate--ammonia-ligase] adenylyltransferase [Gammaproteobacteria bacterium]